MSKVWFAFWCLLGVAELAALVVLVRRKFTAGRLYELLPSLFWTGAMVLPFLVQYPWFGPEKVNLQGLGVFLIAFVLLATDGWDGGRKAAPPREKPVPAVWVEGDVNYATYRLFLVPAEVSHWWYRYFPDHSGGYLGLSGLTPGSRSRADFRHPANAVGFWAYRARHPNQYGETVRAYASVDADAYARGGVLGIFLCAIALGLFRFSLKALGVGDVWSRYLGFAGCMILGLILPNGSIFAALVVQGAGVYLVLITLLRVKRRALPF
jgi:hypothetical protein